MISEKRKLCRAHVLPNSQFFFELYSFKYFGWAANSAHFRKLLSLHPTVVQNSRYRRIFLFFLYGTWYKTQVYVESTVHICWTLIILGTVVHIWTTVSYYCIYAVPRDSGYHLAHICGPARDHRPRVNEAQNSISECACAKYGHSPRWIGLTNIKHQRRARVI